MSLNYSLEKICKEESDLYKLLNENNPIISIILPVYNSENYILECLESIKIQTIKL